MSDAADPILNSIACTVAADFLPLTNFSLLRSCQYQIIACSSKLIFEEKKFEINTI